MSFLRSMTEKDIDPKKLGIDDSLLDLLYEIAILGCIKSYFVHAEAILEGYKAIKPKSERVNLGRGILAMSRADYKNAEAIFKDEILKKINPNSSYARAYLGLVYKSTNRLDDAKKALSEVVKTNKEIAAVKLAQAALDQIKEAEKNK